MVNSFARRLPVMRVCPLPLACIPPPPTPIGQDLMAICKPILVQINQQMARIASTGRVYRLAANVLAAAYTV